MESVQLNSKYDGPIVHGRYEGYGTYETPNGKYVGEFLDGKFHGEGTLYVEGGFYRGDWEHGRLVDGSFEFNDGLAYKKENWEYLTEDPRFHIEIKEGADGPTYITSHNNDLPSDCYDVIDGYYRPARGAIFSYKDHQEVRKVEQEEKQWILENCRCQKE